jgi:hypothetical protein
MVAPRVVLASPVGVDAFVGELTRGNIGTIPASEETTNTQRFEEEFEPRLTESESAVLPLNYAPPAPRKKP